VLVLLAGLVLPALTPAQTAVQPARLFAIFVVDGLRPDSITPADTPTIARLRSEGVDYGNSHSVFPTATRVNAATLATGSYPVRHGIVGNSMFVAGVNDRAPFDTGDYRQLLELARVDGRATTAPTLGEVLQQTGRKLVTVSSGTTGNGFLLNPEAQRGAGVAIHGLFDPGRTAAYPQAISDVVIQRFGSPPPDPDDLGQMEWTDTVLRDYVLTDLRPDVVIDWMGPLDSAQHANGVGSPQAKDALRRIDASLSRTIARMQGVAPQLDVIITSDHGFSHHTEGVNVTQALIAAGLKKEPTSTDVIVASQGQAVLFYVPGHGAARIAEVASFLQRQPWADVVFTRGGKGDRGDVPGTFSFDLIQASHASRSADIAVSLAWGSNRNQYGVPGTQTINSSTTGRLTGGASGHGGLSPWVVHNTLIAWGSHFRTRARTDAPASLADLTPTILAILGTDRTACDSGCGRVLREALKSGQGSTATVSRRVVRAEAGAYRASVQVSTVDGHDYVDLGSRDR
jgi:arylsulfatase A-like enzyme